MGTEVQRVQPGTSLQQWESPDALNRRINRMIEIQRNVMKAKVDYDTIPGCDKPSLLKPGAELLGVTFGISDDLASGYPERIDEDGGNERYIVKLDFTDRATGLFLGCGIGEASTAEEKYAWRRAVCASEWDDTDIDRRRKKYYKDGSTVDQVRTNPADIRNTVLKMAKKRAKVDGILNVLAASRVFSQDLEELPEGMDVGDGDRRSSKPTVTMPTETQKEPLKQRAAQPADDKGPTDAERKTKKLISSAQEKRLFAICKGANVSLDDLKAWLKKTHGHDHLWQITWAGRQYENICKALETNPGQFKSAPAEQRQAVDSGGEVLVEIRELARRAGCEDDESFLGVLLGEWSVQSLDDFESAPRDLLEQMKSYFEERIPEGK